MRTIPFGNSMMMSTVGKGLRYSLTVAPQAGQARESKGMGASGKKEREATPPFLRQNRWERLLLLGSSLLGSLEGVDLGFLGLDLHLHMGREVANPHGPFPLGGWVGAADLADGPIDDPLAPLAVLHNGLTGPLCEDAALLPPERALGAR